MLRGPTVRAPQLKQLLKDQKSIKPKTIRLFDAAYTLKEPVDHEKFMQDGYGRFHETTEHKDFLRERIDRPRAVHFDLNLASYPGKYERASLYPPTLFKSYMQQLGVNKGDPVVVYGRGQSGGMLFAARVWWLLKMYGMEDVAVLEGGLERWKAEGGMTNTTGKLTVLEKWFTMAIGAGDWEPSKPKENLLVTYDELVDYGLFDRLDEVNMLDCRPAEEFDGRKPLAFPPNGAPGARLSGAKCVPLSAVMTPVGELKEPEEIRQVLRDAGYDPAKPTYTMCNGGTQAALLGLALEKAGVKWKLFNGSLREVSKRNPSLINAKG